VLKLSSQKNKSGRPGKTSRPLLSFSKKGSLKFTIIIFKRRHLSFELIASKKNPATAAAKNTKFIFSIYIFSRYLAFKILYQKDPYKGLRYQNSLNPSYLLSVILLIGGLGGALYFMLDLNTPKNLGLNQAIALPVRTAISDKSTADKGLPFSKPKHITVPSVGIDYDIMELGQNPDNTMETPPLFEKITGWYKYGPSPGQIGPAVIVGHVDTYKGPSVFWKLREIKAGDEISIAREDSSVVKFKVTALQQFDQSNFPTDAVYGNTDDAQLRLITCGGTFNKKTLRYSENTVVFASLVR